MGLLDQIPGLAKPDPNVKGLIKWVDASGATKALTAAVRGYTDERTAEVVQQPVEGGSVISDHVIQNPDTLSLELIESNTPITIREGFDKKALDLSPFVRASRFSPSGLLAITRAAGAAVGAVVEAVGSLFGSNPSVPSPTTLQSEGEKEQDIENNLYTLLIQLKENPPSSGVEISVGGRQYESFLLARVSKTKTALGPTTFPIDGVRFRTVSTASVPLPDPSKEIAKGAQGRGNKPPKPLTDEAADALAAGETSGAKALLDKLF